MYVKIKHQDLAEALDKIFVTVAKSLKNIPGASAVRIVFKDGKLIFYGRSMNDSIMVSVPLEESNGEDCYFGASCIDLKKLVDTFHVKDVPVLLVYDSSIDSGPISLCVKYGLSMFNLWTLGAEHMSPIEDFAGAPFKDLDLSDFLLGLKSVSYCMHTDRDNMKGTNVDEKYLASTDGMRLSLYENTQLHLGGGSDKIMISPESVARILTIFKGDKGERESYARDQTSLTILKDKVCYRTRLSSSRFPAYESILPKDQPIICSVQKKEVLASLERITAMSNKTPSPATLSLYPKRQEMEIYTKTDKGAVEDYMEIAYEGPEVVFKMNPRFLIDTIKKLKGDMIAFGLRFNDRGSLVGVVEISEGPHRNFLNPIKGD